MDIKRDDKRVEVRLDGDLVSTITDEVREELKKLVAEGATVVSLDMAKTEVIDSIGLGLVISLHNSLAKAGGSLSVVNLSPDIQGLFRNMRLDRHFTVTGA
jgi:serine/threonine-protein kinase RsbW